MALDTIPKQEGGKLKAVASGTLPSGQPVVVNSDGTVSAVEETDVSQGLGSATVFTSNEADWLDSDFDVNADRVVIAYKDNGNSQYGTAVVGTISGTSISFGTPVVFRSGSSSYMAVTYEPVAQKVVISFEDADGSPSAGASVVGTVSGTSISFGSIESFEDGTVRHQVSTYDSTSGKIVIAYAINTFFKAVVGTVSGTSISFGTPAQIDQSSSSYRYTGIAYDPTADKIVVVGSDLGSSTRAKASVGTVSGTSISFGTQVEVNGSTQSTENPVVYDGSIQKVIVANNDDGNSGFVKIGTISGTSISFSSASTFNASGASRIKMVYDSNAQKTVIYYGRGSGFNVRPTLIVGTASASSVSFGSDVYLTGETGDASLNPAGLAFDSVSNKVVTSYYNYTDTNGEGIVFRNASTDTNLTSENYIGMSRGVVDVDSQTEDIGSPVVYNNAGNTTKPHLCFDTSNNKVVIGFVDNALTKKGSAIVGTVSGTSISFGTKTVYEQSVTDFPAMVYDSDSNKVIVAYQDEGNSDYGTVAVGTVSGTSISFGTPVVFESAAVQHVSLAFDSNSNKVVISYSDHGNSEYGTAIVGTVSGTTMSFGSAVVFESAQTARVSSTFDSSNNKVVVAYRTITGKSAVGTVSGTSISFGTPVEFYNALTDELDIVFDSNVNKVVIAYQSSASDAGLAKVGTVSGTSISFGTEATFESASVASISPVFDSSINKVVLVYSDLGNSRYGTYAVGTISGTDITFGTPSVFASVDTRSVGAVFDTTSSKIVTAYRDDSNSSYGTSVVMVPGYTDITRGEVADGDAATVDIVGTVSTNQVSLTAGQKYYVQTDGTLSETPDDPSVLAGTAVSATKLVVKS